MTTDAKQQTRILVQAAAQVCEDKKGADTRILELDPIDSGLSDFFLITSASNDRQAVAIADEIEHRLKKEFGVFPNAVEGRRLGEWVLLDYVDFVVHVFLVERRAFYDIERLRKSARPLTPAEFDAELKTELAAKTVAVRKKAAVKAKPAAAAARMPAKPKAAKATPAGKTPAKTIPTKKASATKTPAKKIAAKSAPAQKAKKTAAPAKAAVGKAPIRKPAAKKASARKAAATKAALKPPARKTTAKKVSAKKATAKRAVTRRRTAK